MEMPLSRSASQLFTLYWGKIGFTENGKSLTVVVISAYLRVALGMRSGDRPPPGLHCLLEGRC